MRVELNAIFDGKALLLEEDIDLKPNTMVSVIIESPEIEKKKPLSFLDTARSLELDGPPDWSARLEEYLTDGDPLLLTADYKLIFRILPEDIALKTFGVLKSQIRSYFDVGPLFIEAVNERFASSRKRLMQCYTDLVDIAKDKAKVLGEVIDDILSDKEDKELYKRRYIHPDEGFTIPPTHDWIIDEHLEKDAEFALALLDKYSDIVDNNIDLKIQKIRAISPFSNYYLKGGFSVSNEQIYMKRKDELNSLFDDISLKDFFDRKPLLYFSVMKNLWRPDDLNRPIDEGWISAKTILDEDPNLFFFIMKDINLEKEAENILNDILEKALAGEDYSELYWVVSIYHRISRYYELKEKITQSNKSESSMVKSVLEEFEKELAKIEEGNIEDDIPF